MSITAILLLLLAVLCSSAGQIIFKLAAMSRKPFRNILLCAVGIAFMLAAVLIWAALLQTMTLTAMVPFAALAYITTPLAALLVFKESMSWVFWLGTLLIVIGVMLTLL
ncbi:MAG TPA: hypothetical protein DEB25_08995 [Desulfobulbaceae bacterium]|nr:hypothetical protein [Desulfobulbaceae bacterium]